MLKTIIQGLSVCALLSAVACGDADPIDSPPDLVGAVTKDMAVGADMPVGCTRASDTCVMSPTSGADILNGCVAGDVVKVDITPYFPVKGYDNCQLPAR